MVQAIPKGFHTVTPAVTLKDSREALEFYTRALGAKEMFVMTSPDGKRVTHVKDPTSEDLKRTVAARESALAG